MACPNCGYNLTGLREARCPECGSQFTLDELFARVTEDKRQLEA
jgi:predicted Zn-ribbon and HTH transcriptional regulator